LENQGQVNQPRLFKRLAIKCKKAGSMEKCISKGWVYNEIYLKWFNEGVAILSLI
jgi:hypothetical protein